MAAAVRVVFVRTSVPTCWLELRVILTFVCPRKKQSQPVFAWVAMQKLKVRRLVVTQLRCQLGAVIAVSRYHGQPRYRGPYADGLFARADELERGILVRALGVSAWVC